MTLIKRPVLKFKQKEKQVNLAIRLPSEYKAKDGLKKCRKCDIIKDVSEYCKGQSNVDGFYSYCKPCKNAYNRKMMKLKRAKK